MKYSPMKKNKERIYSALFFTKKLQEALVLDDIDFVTQMARWTRSVDVFDKEILVIPINESLHWSLIIVTFPGQLAFNKTIIKKSKKLSQSTSKSKVDRNNWISVIENHKKIKAIKEQRCKILHMDSLRGCHNPKIIYHNIRKWLQMEWNRKKIPERRVFDAKTMPGVSIGVPQQKNNCDCGVFVLQCAKMFLTNPFYDSGNALSRNQWFEHSGIVKIRTEIKNLLCEMRHKQGWPAIDIDAEMERLDISVESQSGQGDGKKERQKEGQHEHEEWMLLKQELEHNNWLLFQKALLSACRYNAMLCHDILEISQEVNSCQRATKSQHKKSKTTAVKPNPMEDAPATT